VCVCLLRDFLLDGFIMSTKRGFHKSTIGPKVMYLNLPIIYPKCYGICFIRT